MTKTYLVSLDKTHTITVKAKNAIEARNKTIIIFPDKEITGIIEVSDNTS